MADPTASRFLHIAEAINDRRVVSKQKARVIDVATLASCVRKVASTPDKGNRGALEASPQRLQCSVCLLWKEAFYFKEGQQRQSQETRICRYCTWRIRTEVDGVYRKIRGLGPRPRQREQEFSDYSGEIDQFLQRSSAATACRWDVSDPPRPSEISVGGYYGPSSANLASGWYLKTGDENYAPDRDAMLQWWDGDCDRVLEWFLRRYGMYFSAFAEEIKKQVSRRLHSGKDWARHFEYFLITRVLTTERLWRILALDLKERAESEHECKSCGATQAWIEIHPDRIRWSNAVVLPLCNDCWKILERTLPPEVPRGRAASDFDGHIDSVLGKKTCPVCRREHSWKEHAYTYTEGFYGVPSRFQEICFACLDEAFNRSSGDRTIRPNRAALLQIAQAIDAPPAAEMFQVVFEQAKSLAVATSVVRIMKSMWTFDRLASRHRGSWFATLVKSGCLPKGTRKEHFGTRVLAKDGHECLSMGEMQIDDLLYRNRIRHRKEVRYPDSDYVCDWVIEIGGREVYVEYFGLAGQDEYDEKIDTKRSIASQAGIELVEFFPEDMRDLAKTFGKKILSLA